MNTPGNKHVCWTYAALRDLMQVRLVKLLLAPKTHVGGAVSKLRELSGQWRNNMTSSGCCVEPLLGRKEGTHSLSGCTRQALSTALEVI